MQQDLLVRYPMKMTPAFKDYIWGGSLLTSRYHKPSPYERTAESWELSCHPAGFSTIANGPYAGETLEDYFKIYGKEIMGARYAKFEEFPVLIKLIDANNNLSIQVHPDDTYAREHEDSYGKTEMWYVVDCAPGASLIYGFEKEVSKEEFRKRIEDNTLLDVLHSVPVHKGDTFMIRPGTIHAIGKGCLIAEIQQSSNITYRVYDYGRLGKDGKPRELHIEKALAVTFSHPVKQEAAAPVEQMDGYTRRTLAACDYFIVDLLSVNGTAKLEATDQSFHALLCAEGDLKLDNTGDVMELHEGDTVFLPAESGNYTLTGNGRVLQTHL